MHSYDPSPQLYAKLVPILCYTVLIAVSIAALIEHYSGLPLMAAFGLGHPQPITAASFIAVGVAMAAAFHLPASGNRLLTGAFVVLYAAMIAAALYTQQNGGSVHFDLPDLASPELASSSNGILVHGFANFLLLGPAIILFRFGRMARRVSAFFAVAVLISAYAAALVHFFRLAAMRFDHSPGLSVVSVALFSIAAIGLLYSNPDFKLGVILRSKTSGGLLARQLLPLVVIVPTVVGFFRVMGQEFGFFGTSFGTMIANFLTVLVMFAIVSLFILAMHASDEKRRSVEAELCANEQRYRHLFEYSQSILSTHDLDGVIRSVNRKLTESLGFSADEVIGKRYADFIPNEFKGAFSEYVRKVVYDGEAKGLASMIAADGQRVVWQYHNVLINDEDGESYVLGSALDVSDLMRVQTELEKMSLTDELTGLSNRRGFLTVAEQMLKLERHSSTARGLMMLFADMDGLKIINDTHGHEAGSEALQALGKILQRSVRSGDVVARWGGDEFVILTIGAEGDEAQQVLDRIRERIEEHNLLSGKPYKVACSFGLAPIHPDKARSLEEVIDEADKAMYEEKKRRKRARNISPEPTSEPMPDTFAWY